LGFIGIEQDDERQDTHRRGQQRWSCQKGKNSACSAGGLCNIKGPYDGVERGYSRFFEYIAEHGLEIAGESQSLHTNDPEEVPEKELLTEVQIQMTKII